MATLSIEAILDRVQELKNECAEKDEVIREQQVQITELEQKLSEITSRCEEQAEQIAQVSAAAGKADELMEKLSQVLA